MQQLDITSGPVSNLSHLIQFISNCDEIINRNPKPLHYEELPKPQNCNFDFLLIGSRALNHYWSTERWPITTSADESIRNSTWTRTIIKKWSEERFNRKSDWDLICMNREALVKLLKSKEFKQVSINYILHYKLKVRDCESDGWNGSNRNFVDWFLDGGQPRRWIEFSVRLEQFDGEIIEIEYCTDRYHLMKYLELSNNVVDKEEVEKLPLGLKDSSCGIAPLQLLEIIKKSHLQFNIMSENWLKHIFDTELIHFILPKSDQYQEESLSDSMNNFIGLVHYDRLTKRIVKSLQDDDNDSLSTKLEKYMFHKYRNDEEDVDKVISPVNEEMLFSAFGVSAIFKEPFLLKNNFQSLSYIAQQVAAYLLSSVTHAIEDSNELEKLVFESVRNAIEYNFDNFLYSIIRDNFMKIAEMVYKMLNKPQVFKELFETRVEMKDFRFENTPIDFENDNVKEVSNMEGATLSNQYLPIEIIMKIASYIPKAHDFANLMRLDKSWNHLFESNDVWKYLYFCRYPTPAHYSFKNDNFKVHDWKHFVLSRSNLERVQFPTQNALDCLSNVFKSKFIGQSTFFKQFVNDFFNNTYIAAKIFKDDTVNEYKTLKASLITYWPRQPPLKYEMEIVLDVAIYRSGDSKGSGRRDTVSGTLCGSGYEYFSDPVKKSKFSIPQNFIGKYYLENMKPDQYAPLFTTLLALGMGNDSIVLWVLGFEWCR